MEAKINKAIQVVLTAVKEYCNPCVLWSGGKDSMVLLHLMRSVGLNFDVVCYRDPWMPKKHVFINEIIQKWNLIVWDYAPSGVALCKGNGRIDVMNHYAIGAQTLCLARGTESPQAEKAWLCGRDTFLKRPLGTFNFPWDCMFLGHKSSDVDPCSGAVPLEIDVLQIPGSAAAVYPLRNWNDEDVFKYIREFEVPYDHSRYEMAGDGHWKILENIDKNPDYYRCCLKCCDPDASEFVTCPKNGLEINNISNAVVWVSPKMSYCNLNNQ